MAASNQMRFDQVAQDARVTQGMDIINSIFNGGNYGIGRTNTIRPGGTYFNSTGTKFPTMPSSSFFSDPAFQAYNKNLPVEVRQNPGLAWNSFLSDYAKNFGLYTGSTKSTGFNDAFYKKAGQAYEDFALPQLATQFNQTNRGLQAGLANRGVLGGSAALMADSALNRETGVQKLNIANAGIGVENDLRSRVANEKNNIVNQLISSGDPSLASQQALSSVAGLSAPSPLPAVGNLFSNFITSYMNSNSGSQGGGNVYGLRLPSVSTQSNIYGIGR